MIAWERGRAASAYGIIWGDANQNKLLALVEVMQARTLLPDSITNTAGVRFSTSM